MGNQTITKTTMKALSEKDKLSSMTLNFEDDVSTQPSILESNRSIPMKGLPTGRDDEEVNRYILLAQKDIVDTRKEINEKIAEIKQEITYSMSASCGNSGEQWSDK